MEEPAQTARRLLSALEDLVSREDALLQGMDFQGAVTIQERAGPLVCELARLASMPGVAGLKARVMSLVAKRNESWRALDGHLARLQSELGKVAEARARLARIAPVYGARRSNLDSRLNAAA
jgi:hypothetical protein